MVGHIRRELAGVQYLRAIAVVLVVLSHAEFIIAQPKYYGRYAFDGYFLKGSIGVDLFFVISGFIIAYTSLSSGSLNPKISLREFAWRRFLRIVPFMWVCIIAHLALKLTFNGPSELDWLAYARALTLFPVGDVQPGQIWSLRHEALFYLVFAIAVLFAKGRLRILLALFFLLPLVSYGTGGNISPSDGFFSELISFVFSRVNILFASGFILCICHLRFPHVIQVVPLGVLSMISLGVLLLSFSNFISYSRYETLHVVMAAILCGAVLFLSLGVSASSGFFSKSLKAVGDASYSIYLVHDIFISIGLIAMGVIGVRVSEPVILLFLSFVACVGGAFVYKFAERPMTVWLSGKRPGSGK